MTSTAPARAFRAEPYDYGEARAIAAALDLAEPVAVTLVRRGHRTVEDARRFLEADEAHDPLRFEGMAAACELILGFVRGGRRITVHGDYDVDGVCATAILVSCLRELGGSCDWLIPDRLGAGYGLSEASVEALARRGTELAVTVDCGIASASEVRSAREAGIEVVVTDHHQPSERLPDCPILHPSLCGYPFAELCGAGVAHKLATALRAAAGRGYRARAELDLVALATVADMVPLVGENRRLVREGLRAMRSRPRLGLRALLAASRTEVEGVDEGALGFRLAPRINAAGRMYRADAGVELMLTDDADRAAAIAAELDRANHERRAAEQEVLEAAERARAALADPTAPALVLAGEGWHPGVVGIVASRLVERHWRPVVLIGVAGERGRGSGRSIQGFDLLGALRACGGHLGRFGGHTMAAGLEIEAGAVDAFREAFVAEVAGSLDPEALVRTERVDALVGVGEEGIGFGLAEQLERLGPFGSGNPDPRLLVPSARVREVRPLGEDGRHSRFDLHSGAGRALGVAFGINGELSRAAGAPLDLSVRLELDRWNGAIQPRVVLCDLYPLEGGLGQRAEAAPGCGSAACPAPGEEWWARVRAELGRAPAERLDRAAAAPTVDLAPRGRRELIDRRGGAAIAAIAELLSSGGSVLALCADASRRRELGARAAHPRRFGGGAPALACSRCGEAALDAALGRHGDGEQAQPGLALADWGALARRSAAASRFEHVVLVDPPVSAGLEALAGIPRSGPGGRAPFAPGFLHLAWGRGEVELAQRCLAAEWALRGPVGEIWRGLRAAGGEAGGDVLAAILAGSGRHPRSAEVAGRCLRVLIELGLCEWDPDRAAVALGVLSSGRTQLERSRTYVACAARHQEGSQFLQSRAQRS